MSEPLTDEHGVVIDEDWAPESPILRGEVRTPDEIIPATLDSPLDELPHRVRRRNGLATEDPDPGYDPADDDLLPA